MIGVNSQISTAQGSSGNVGIGFAVPSNTVKEVVAQLDRDRQGRPRLPRHRRRARITPELARVFRLPVDSGVLVEDVGDGTAGARAGLKAGTSRAVVAGESYTLGGDVIVAVAGKRVASLEELRDVLADHKPGETMKLKIYRGTRQLTLEVKLGRQPASPQG